MGGSRLVCVFGRQEAKEPCDEVEEDGDVQTVGTKGAGDLVVPFVFLGVVRDLFLPEGFKIS